MNMISKTSLFLVCLLLFSCKTETIIAPAPYADIISYKIPYDNGKDSINAIIENNNIIINWPGMSEWPIPQKLKPKIVVSKNAKISPASEQEIELKTGLKYEVKAEDGTTKSFEIKLNNTAKLPFFPEGEIRKYRRGQTAFIAVLNLASDGSDKLTLFNEAKKEFYPIPSLKNPLSGFMFIVDQANGQEIPPGEYTAKITNKFNQEIYSSKPVVNITDLTATPYPNLDLTEPLKLKSGDEFTVPLKYANKDVRISAALLTYVNNEGNRSYIMLQILGVDYEGAKLKLGIPKSYNNELTSTLDQTIRLITSNGEGSNPMLKHPIQIVK